MSRLSTLPVPDGIQIWLTLASRRAGTMTGYDHADAIHCSIVMAGARQSTDDIPASSGISYSSERGVREKSVNRSSDRSQATVESWHARNRGRR